MVDDYTLTSMSEVKKLQRELESLKQDPLGQTASGKNVMENLENVSEGLGSMMNLFKEASEQMKLEEREEEILANKIGPILDKLEAIEDQNKKIAQGIVAVADMVEELSAKVEGSETKMEKPSEPTLRPISPPLMAPMGEPTAPPEIQEAPGAAGMGMMPPQRVPDLPGAPMQPPPMMPPSGAPMPPPIPGPMGKPAPSKKKGFMDMFVTK